METDNKRWEVYCYKKEFDLLKNDEKFLNILKLSRITNAIYFCHISAIKTSKEKTPSNSRQIINSLIYANAILFEGVNCAKFLGKFYKDKTEYLNGFAKLFKSQKFRNLYNKYLKNIRNKISFHFDISILGKTIADFDSNENIFATGLGEKRCDTYYNLADEIAIHYLIRESNISDKDLKERFSTLLSDLEVIISDFIVSSDNLIAICIKEFGFKFRYIT